MEKKPNHFSAQDAIALAKSPAGQQLIAFLQRSGGDEVRQAAQFAASGDYTQAQQMLSGLLKDPEVMRLLSQLGG